MCCMLQEINSFGDERNDYLLISSPGVSYLTNQRRRNVGTSKKILENVHNILGQRILNQNMKVGCHSVESNKIVILHRKQEQQEIFTKTRPRSPPMHGIYVFSCQDGIHLGWRRRPGLDGGLGGSSWTVEKVRELRDRLWGKSLPASGKSQ